MKGPAPVMREAITAVLEKHGPLHASAIARLLNKNISSVRSSIRLMHARKLIHISDWHRSIGISSGRIASVYSLGQGRDKPPPKLKKQIDANKNYKDKFKKVIQLRKKKSAGKPIDHWLVLLGAR